MSKIKVGLPSASYVLNLLITLAIIAFVVKTFIPDRYSQYIRW